MKLFKVLTDEELHILEGIYSGIVMRHALLDEKTTVTETHKNYLIGIKRELERRAHNQNKNN